jgi:DNA-binding transcriptional LysR family regulator
MDLRHLRYFQAVAREEHFGRAARAIRVAQPALTRQIKDLEKELGLLLFERLPRGVRLSTAGRALLDETNLILDQLDRTVAKVQGYARGEFGAVRVGFNEIASRHPDIPPKILNFRLRAPGVELKLLSIGSQAQLDGLRNGSVDVAILYDVHYTDTDVDLYDFRDIGSSEMVLALYSGHPLVQKKTIRMADLAGERFLFPIRRDQPRPHDRLMQACLSHGFSPNIIQEVVTHSIMLSLVAVGMGVGFTQNAQTAVPDGVILRPVKDLDLTFRMHLLWRKSDPSPAVSRFVEAMA